MRVKISHTIDLEELPSIIEKIVTECRQTLERNANHVHVTMYDVPKMTQSFEETIEDLDLVAVKLQDAINIAAGWHQARLPVLEQKDQPEKENE